MAICTECKKEYDIIEDKAKFNRIYSTDCDAIIQDYCFNCASSINEAQNDVRVCENCGKRFYFNEDDEDFMLEHETFLDGGYFNKCLCGKCAEEAMEFDDYYETCSNCGKRFHVGEHNLRFENECGEYHLENGCRDYYGDGNLCADCALDAARKGYEESPEYFDDNEDHGGLSVYDAAIIWASRGRDDDYMFGYTEEELEVALK